jgi:ketosteroid isomerase-like protein
MGVFAVRLVLLTILLSLAVSAAPAWASDDADSLLNADRALAAQSRAVGYVAAFSRAMAPDARKLDGGSFAAIGSAAVLALMARYSADLRIDRTPQEAVVAKSGEMGFTWGTLTVTYHDKSGNLVTRQGKYLDVWRRDHDGTWRWIADTPA